MFGIYDKYIAVFLTALLTTYLLTPWVRSLATRFGVVDMPGGRRAHKSPTARGGGLAVVLGVHAACLVALIFPGSGRPGGFDFNWWIGFVPASAILLVVGVIDDVRGMSPWKKLLGQVMAAMVVCVSGTRFGKLFEYQLPWFLDALLVVVWIVAIINAFNLIDGLDGLASGLAIISATGLCGILFLGHLPGVAIALVALVGACLAFLRYNFHPATIFLGDTGSMFIGLVLGMISLQTFTKNTFFLSMAIPLLVLGVPIYDSLLAVWRRSVRKLLNDRELAGGKRSGIMSADVEHLHHRLLRAGLSTRSVATVLFIVNAGLVIFGLLITSFQSHASGILLLALLASVYVLLRHMAVIELRDTGKVLLTGLRRPTHALLKGLAFPFWDMFCLTSAVAIGMCAAGAPGVGFWKAWFLELPIWVTPTFTLLALSRTYVTVWTRARVLDVLMLLFTMLAGLVSSIGIALLIDPSSLRSICIRAIITGAIGHTGIVAVRVFYRCAEEIVLYLKSNSDLRADHERVVLYGAGGRCQLYLKERGFSNSSSFDGRVVVGLIDDEPALHLKWVHGHQVLGGVKDLAQLIPRHRISSIVITAKLRTESLSTLRELADQHGIQLSEWRFQYMDPEIITEQPANIPPHVSVPK